MATISSENGSGVIAMAAERALLGDGAGEQGKHRWWRQQGIGGDCGTVVAAMAAAATNSDDNISGAMAVAVDRALIGDWVKAQGQRWRPHWYGRVRNGRDSGRQWQ